MSVGYYSSKKTDDICEDVCGQVIYSSYSSIKVLIFFSIGVMDVLLFLDIR
jgi:hypothetical protein